MARSSAVAEHLRPGVAGGLGEVLEAHREREELAQAVPAQVVLLDQLLHVLGRRAPGARLEEPAAVDQRDDRQHLGGRAELEDREEVGEVVAQHVAGHRDGVLALADPLQGERDRLDRRQDPQVQAVGVVVGEVGPHLRDQVGVVGAVGVQPEDRGRGARPGPGDGELDPVADRDVLGLAHPPDVAGGHDLLEHDVAVRRRRRARCRSWRSRRSCRGSRTPRPPGPSGRRWAPTPSSAGRRPRARGSRRGRPGRSRRTTSRGSPRACRPPGRRAPTCVRTCGSSPASRRRR